MAYENSPSLAETLGSPAFFEGILAANPVYLVSANMPGSGSTTFVHGLAENIAAKLGIDPQPVYAGQAIRELTGVFDREGVAKAIRESNQPEEFDRSIYASLPEDRPCIVSGELATILGPHYIGGNRPVICIDLTSQPVIAAKRILEREGSTLADIFRGNKPAILGQLAVNAVRISELEQTRARAMTLAGSDGANVHRFTADTSVYSAQELIDHFSGEGDFSRYVPSWEYQSLQNTLAILTDLRAKLGNKVHRIDVTHYNYHLEAIRYNAERLRVVLYPEAIAEVRATLRKAITDCWFGLTMKETPRFFADKAGNTILDTESEAWTPHFYKIAEAWPVLSTILKGKHILDPFAGAGTLANMLMARDIPASVVMSDIAYQGGGSVDDDGHTYLPDLNSQASRLVFDSLPSWYRPDFSPLKGYVTADAHQLPFPDQSFDYVVGDPPYGRRHPTGGIDLTLSMLDECLRVAREGVVFLLPDDWPPKIVQAGYKVERLTREVSRGLSKHPVCYVRVTKP